jgi:recombination protein RecA
MVSKKKTTKKAAQKTEKPVKAKKKKTEKKSAKKKGGKSVLAQAKAVLDGALKTPDWKADLDTSRISESLPHLPSGSIILDQLIGGKPNEKGIPPCPGIPIGKIFNLYGHEGSGKTTVALTAAATTIANGGCVCYIDWENEIVPSYAKALGVPIGDEDKFILSQPETLEQGCAVIWTMANAGVDLVILDSVGAGVPKALAEKSVKEVADQGRLGANAAVWSAFLPKLKGRINKTGTTILAISQLRSAVNVMGYGEQFTVQGGKAWRFYSALRMHLKAIGKDKATVYSSLTNKAEDRVVGVKTRARLEKCKVSPQQGNEEIFYIRWGQGIDDLRSLIEIGLAHKLIRKKGAWYYWIDPEGTEHSGQGLEKFRTRFEKDAQNLKALQRQIQPYLASKGGENLDQEIDEDAPEAESFQTDKELEDLLSSISSDEPPADTD